MYRLPTRYVLIGLLVVIALFSRARGWAGELILFGAVLGAALLGGRAAWRWWRGHPVAIASTGVVGALGAGVAGWAYIALFYALSQVSSGNHGMIIVWPIVLLLGTAVLCCGLVAIVVGVAAVVTAMTKLPPHRGLIAIGGVAAVILNLLHMLTLARFVSGG